LIGAQSAERLGRVLQQNKVNSQLLFHLY